MIILSDTKISDTGLEHLKTLPKINLIRMHDTQVTDRGRSGSRVRHCRSAESTGKSVPGGT